MILITKITVEELAKNGKNHKWDKFHCEECHRFMWGHGFVFRYFSSISDSVYLKRYRCPQCLVVVTVRPEGYWPFIRSSISTIYSILNARILNGFWPEGFPRQRGGHWLKRFAENAKMNCQENLLNFLQYCFEKQLRFFH
jgi:hypothetical protein